MRRSALRNLGIVVLGGAIGTWIAAAVVRGSTAPSMCVADAIEESAFVSEPDGETAQTAIGTGENSRPPREADDSAESRDARAPAPAPALPRRARPSRWPTFAEAEQQFSLESDDAAWSRGAASGILDKLSVIPELDLLDAGAECRATLCRVRLLFPEKSETETLYALRQIFALAYDVGLHPLASEIAVDDSGLPVLRLFLRRQQN
jgi:hypothetical protein